MIGLHDSEGPHPQNWFLRNKRAPGRCRRSWTLQIVDIRGRRKTVECQFGCRNMHGEATRIKTVLQGVHGYGVVLPCLMVCGSGTTGGFKSRSATGWVGRTPGRVAWRGAWVTHESYGWGPVPKAVLCSYLTSGCT